METFAPASAGRHTSLCITTEHPTQFVDITDQVEAFVARAGAACGIVNIQTLHTTTGIVVNEHEPLLLLDFQALLEGLSPRDAPYRHDDASLRTVNVTEGERPNGHSHCRALLLPASACLNVAGGQLLLGRWQRVFFVELDGPREREVSMLAFGEAWR